MPSERQPYATLNSNGGLIDFQDNRVLEQPYTVPAVANLQGYTTQSTYIASNGQVFAMPPTAVVMGAPSEVYAHGKTYKLVDEPVATVAAPDSPAAPAELHREYRDVDVDKRVAQKVSEFMKMNKSAGNVHVAKSTVKKNSAKDEFKKTMQEIITKNKKH